MTSPKSARAGPKALMLLIKRNISVTVGANISAIPPSIFIPNKNMGLQLPLKTFKPGTKAVDPPAESMEATLQTARTIFKTLTTTPNKIKTLKEQSADILTNGSPTKRR